MWEEHPPNWVVYEALWLVVTTAVVVRYVDSPLLTGVVVGLFILSSPVRYVAQFVDWRPRGRLADAGQRLADGPFVTAVAVVSFASLVLALAWREAFWLVMALGLFVSSLLQLTLVEDDEGARP